jgi:hypothetical protein
MTCVQPPRGAAFPVRNLGWFFRKARVTTVDYLSMVKRGHGWRMRAAFHDGFVFSTDYASLDVFKRTMKRQRSLKGVSVVTFDGNDQYAMVL